MSPVRSNSQGVVRACEPPMCHRSASRVKCQHDVQTSDDGIMSLSDNLRTSLHGKRCRSVFSKHLWDFIASSAVVVSRSHGQAECLDALTTFRVSPWGNGFAKSCPMWHPTKSGDSNWGDAETNEIERVDGSISMEWVSISMQEGKVNHLRFESGLVTAVCCGATPYCSGNELWCSGSTRKDWREKSRWQSPSNLRMIEWEWEKNRVLKWSATVNGWFWSTRSGWDTLESPRTGLLSFRGDQETWAKRLNSAYDFKDNWVSQKSRGDWVRGICVHGTEDNWGRWNRKRRIRGHSS
jgi:hypothetical protein